MLTIRLPQDLEREIDRLAKDRKISRSALVKEALASYIKGQKLRENPYELGIDLFGAGRGGDPTLSVTYKERVRGKIGEKHTH